MTAKRAGVNARRMGVAQVLANLILRKAKRMAFIAIEGHISSSLSIKDAVAHLEANGIAAIDKTVPNSEPGEAILARRPRSAPTC